MAEDKSLLYWPDHTVWARENDVLQHSKRLMTFWDLKEIVAEFITDGPAWLVVEFVFCVQSTKERETHLYGYNKIFNEIEYENVKFCRRKCRTIPIVFPPMISFSLRMARVEEEGWRLTKYSVCLIRAGVLTKDVAYFFVLQKDMDSEFAPYEDDRYLMKPEELVEHLAHIKAMIGVEPAVPLSQAMVDDLIIRPQPCLIEEAHRLPTNPLWCG